MNNLRLTRKARRYLATREQREAAAHAEWLLSGMSRTPDDRTPEQRAANARAWDAIFGTDDEQPRPCYNIARSRS